MQYPLEGGLKLKKYLPVLMMSIFVFGTLFSCVIAGAAENTATNKTASQISKTSESVNKSVSGSESCSINENKTAVGSSVAEQKFRVGPTVVLRPVNDVITENQDGLVELYIDNPSLNDVTLNVDARISVPSSIHVYGQGFGQAGAAGTVYGTFTVPPGTARTININVKGEKVGTYTVHFSGMYWPGDNKDCYNPISLTHPFVIQEASKNPGEASNSDNNTGGVKADGKGSFSVPGFDALIATIGLLGVYIARRK